MKKTIFLIFFLLPMISIKAQVPSFAWAKGLLGLGNCIPMSVALDTSGNVYTTGYYSGTIDFDPGIGVVNVSGTGVFVSKLDAFGNFIWVKEITPGALIDGNSCIVLDKFQNIYITGSFSGSVDFDPSSAVFNLTSLGGKDIFILKLDPLGDFVFAKQMGGMSDDISRSIKVDQFSNIYTTGYFYDSADFDPGAGVTSLIANAYPNANVFVSKLNATGSFVWAKSLGGVYDDEGCSITLDTFGNVYASGYFSDTADFDPGSGIFNLICTGGTNSFLSKLDSTGNLGWAKEFGKGSSSSSSFSTLIDLSNNIYVMGTFGGIGDFDPNGGTYNLIAAAVSDVYISKLDFSGNFLWAKNFGGFSGTTACSITTDAFNNLYSTGEFLGTIDFDPGIGVYNLTSVGTTGYSEDIFISKLDSLGNFKWAKAMGGNTEDIGMATAIDKIGNIFTVGYFHDTTDFNPDAGIFYLNPDLGGVLEQNGFVHKMGQGYLGVYDYKETNKVSIYPNPTSDQITISTFEFVKKSIVEIYNGLGALVLNQAIIGQQNNIDLKNLANGIYFVRVMSEGKIVGTQKIVKE